MVRALQQWFSKCGEQRLPFLTWAPPSTCTPEAALRSCKYDSEEERWSWRPTCRLHFVPSSVLTFLIKSGDKDHDEDLREPSVLDERGSDGRSR